MIDVFYIGKKLEKGTIEDLDKAKDKPVWIDATNITKHEANILKEKFNLHPLTAEDLFNDKVRIKVEDLVVPNVITPNGDGKNDQLQIFGIERYTSSELMILNRWGKEVFRAAPYTNNWDGVAQNGNELPEDTYYYIIKIDEDDVRKGFIMILR